MAQFSPHEWLEVEHGKEFQHSGTLQLQASGPVALYVAQDGFEALAGFGSSFRLDISGSYTFRLEGKGRSFLRSVAVRPADGAFEEAYTELDMRSQDGGHMRAVTAAVRQMKLEARALMQQLRADARAGIRQDEKAAPVLEPDPVAEPEVDPGPDPDAKA